MKYYKVKIKRRYDTIESVIGHANGEYVPAGAYYFDRIGKGEIIADAPVFDYFHLQSFGPKTEWEWRLQDAHGFMGVGSIITGWYISLRFKELLSGFNIGKEHHFYPTKLLYKGQKLDYWIFQYGNILNRDLYIDFRQSAFYDELKQENVSFHDFEAFTKHKRAVGQATEYEKDVVTQKIVFKQVVDFIPFFGINSLGEVVSERLKLAIEGAGLEGLAFSEIDYEIM